METSSVESKKIDQSPNPVPSHFLEMSSKKSSFFTKKILILFLLFLIILIPLGSLYFYSQLISKNIGKSCGGDWSYNVKCPSGTYCKSLGMGPLAGGICTPNFSLFNPFSQKESSTSTVRKNTPTPTPPINLKKYSNSKFGIEFEYPIKGVTKIGSESSEINCGNAIKESNNIILVDNLFKIQILDWQKTIDDYLIQKGAKNKYELTPITTVNADEAIKVIDIKKGLELSSIGYPPLMNILAIYKKDDRLFLITNLDDTSNGGCINPKQLNAGKFTDYANQNWSPLNSFKFVLKNEKVFCTQEAKLCPDGSSVGRTGLKCEFAKCPGE